MNPQRKAICERTKERWTCEFWVFKKRFVKGLGLILCAQMKADVVIGLCIWESKPQLSFQKVWCWMFDKSCLQKLRNLESARFVKCDPQISAFFQLKFQQWEKANTCFMATCRDWKRPPIKDFLTRKCDNRKSFANLKIENTNFFQYFEPKKIVKRLENAS